MLTCFSKLKKKGRRKEIKTPNLFQFFEALGFSTGPENSINQPMSLSQRLPAYVPEWI
jgi:hypothetical protein